MEKAMRKILVIDDNEDNLLTLKAIITDLFEGFVTFTSTSGAKGIAMAKIHQPDVILLDILMPVMDGFEVCKILKEDESLRDIPVVFVTALKENKENKARAIEAGAEGFLTKPVEEQELVVHINAMIKIKEANDFRKSEKHRLEMLVNQRTKELQESEWQHRQSQAIAHLGHWNLDLHTNKLQWSDEVYRIFGLKPQEFQPNYEALLNYIHPHDRDFVDTAYRTSIQKHIPFDIEHRVLLDDGSTKYVNEKCVTYYDDHGNPTRSLGTVKDITERKQAEEKLQQNRNMLDNILNTIPQTVFWKDRECRYLGCNTHFAKAVGLQNPEDIVGLTDFDLPWPKEEAEAYRADDLYVMDNNESRLHIIEPLQQADGSRLWIDTTKIPLQDGNGKVYGVLGVYEDVTERKKAEIALHQAGDILQNMQMGLYVYELENPEDDRTLQMIAANPASRKLSGVPAESVIGKYIDEIFPGLRELGIPKRFADVVRTGKAGEFEDFFYADQRVLEAAYSVKAFPLPNRRVGITFDNITERKLSDQRLKESDERYRNLVETINSGVAVYKVINDGISGFDFIIQDFNQFALKHEKLNKDEVVGKSLKDIRPNIDEYGLIDIFRKVWKTGESTYFPAKVYIDEKYSRGFEINNSDS